LEIIKFGETQDGLM